MITSALKITADRTADCGTVQLQMFSVLRPGIGGDEERWDDGEVLPPRHSAIENVVSAPR